MDIFQHFGCHTKLPIKLDDVRDHILETGMVESIQFFDVDVDTTGLQGFCRVFEQQEPGMYTSSGQKVAHIFYAAELEEEEKRLVVCKELLHILDDHSATAQTRDEVDSLIEQIVLPLDVRQGLQSKSDHIGILHALAVLMPRDALAVLRPLHDDNKLSVEDVAALARVPERYARFALSPAWQQVLEIIQ